MQRHLKTIFGIFAVLILAQAIHAQKTPTFNRDSSKCVTKVQFDTLVDAAISLLKTKELPEIPDSGHVNIMMCLNTIFMAHSSNLEKRFICGRYEQLEEIADEKKYIRKITEVYKEWVPNRGMGFYFPKLQMELYGTPMLYAWFRVDK